ncbi:MAG: LON peptidase substrate-binding domain-containing protein [Planctomycetaceae bacterium]
MPEGFESFSDLSDFGGTLPVFPLAGVVMFPFIGVPLHIFEPRYRKMVSDALAGEGLLALALPAPGGGLVPDLSPVLTVGRITEHERLAGGKYNLVLTGVSRATLVEELLVDEPYRVISVDLLEDQYPESSGLDRDAQRIELMRAFQNYAGGLPTEELFKRVLDSDVSLGFLCDLLVSSLNLPVESQYEALAELNVNRRSSLVLRWLRQMTTTPQPNRPIYPFRFSQN